MDYDFKLLDDKNISDLMQLEKRCFTDSLAETEKSFLHLAEIYSEGALLLYKENEIIGSIFFHPFLEGKVQELRDCNIVLTGDENCMYLHSFSIHPDYRGKGLTHILFNYFEKKTRDEEYNVQALVAVQNSESFWTKIGFKPVRRFLYGNSLSTYMTRCIS